MAKILKIYSAVALKTGDLGEKFDYPAIFGRSAPVHIEIGSGKGTFLVNQARTAPDADFLGIEWASKFYRYAVDRVGRWNLTNVRLIRDDAANLLANFMPDNSVNCFHIYFPDPWPKKRHHKRRFVSNTNLVHILRCLKTKGCLRIATDHAEYFDHMQFVLAQYSDQFESIDFLPAAGATQNEWVGSNFERKYLKQNRPIFTLALRKK